MYKIIKILILIFFGFLINTSSAISGEEKIKVGLLVPLTGDDKKLGQQIIKSVKSKYFINDISKVKFTMLNLYFKCIKYLQWNVLSFIPPRYFLLV